MTFFVKVSASFIFKKVGGLSTDFEYFLKCTKSQKRTYAQLILYSKYAL